MNGGSGGRWVLLSYQLPREPSTRRVAVWRKLRRLGVIQLLDGLVALPADARTREQLEWVAEEAVEAGGSAAVWLAQPASTAHERTLVQAMAAARAEEYRTLAEEALAALELTLDERGRALKRLRERGRQITRRDFYPPVERDAALAALAELAATTRLTPSATAAEMVDEKTTVVRVGSGTRGRKQGEPS